MGRCNSPSSSVAQQTCLTPWVLILLLGFISWITPLTAGVAWTPTSPSTTPYLRQPGNPVLSWRAGSDNLLRNGDFEAGLTNGWTLELTHGQGFTVIYAGKPSPANIPLLEGSASALCNGERTHGYNAIYQDIQLPANVTSAVVSWLARMSGTVVPYLYALRLEVRDLENRVLATPFAADQSTLPYHSAWGHSADLSPFIGRKVRLAFVVAVGPHGLFELDDVRVQTTPLPGVEFELFLSKGGPISETNLLCRTSTLSWRAAGLQPSSYYRWQVITVRGAERTPGPAWTFRTADPFLLDHYEVLPVASPQVVGEEFAFRVNTRDASDFEPMKAPAVGTAALNLAAIADERVAPRLLISEVFVATEYSTKTAVEFANVSSEPVDVSRWQVAIYDYSNYRAPHVRFTIPDGTTVSPGAVFMLHSRGKSPGAFPDFYAGSEMSWYLGYSSPAGVALLDEATNLVDFIDAELVEPLAVTGPAPVGLDQ